MRNTNALNCWGWGRGVPITIGDGLLEDLAHQDRDVGERPHAAGHELLVEGVELLDRELVEDGARLACWLM